MKTIKHLFIVKSCKMFKQEWINDTSFSIITCVVIEKIFSDIQKLAFGKMDTFQYFHF